MILFKVRFDAKIIDSAFQKIITNQATKLKTHFVCDSYYYYWSHEDKLRSLILEGMKKYGIQSVMLTIMFMARDKLSSIFTFDCISDRSFLESSLPVSLHVCYCLAISCSFEKLDENTFRNFGSGKLF